MKELNIGSDMTLRKIIKELVENDFLTVKKGSIYTGNSQYFIQTPNIYDSNTS